MTGRLVVVSNRLSLVREGQGDVGGLAVAVLAALREQGGIWFGWSGEIASAPARSAKIEQTDGLTYATIDLTRRDHTEYYGSFSNGVLWPLFHFRPGLIDFNRRAFEGYQRVNRRFAEALAPLLEPDDTVWVHDYHLIPLGARLRELGVRQPIGFFLHTPLAAYALLHILPPHRELMSSLLAYDVVGFQTASDRQAFLDYARAELGAHISDGIVSAQGRTVKAGVFPIGIDAEEVIALSERHRDSVETRRLRRSLQGRALIVGVDRLDYSKGLVERFRAFERMLERFPGERGRVSLMQIAPPSRTNVGGYREIRRDLERRASEVNGRFADFDWVPIRYLNRSFSRNDLACFYRFALVGLVTPLRDGMNLVAKEYVAAQDPDNPGVLVLSRFAGAADELDQALLVNPFDIDEIAEAMQAALWMSRDERMRRWQSMIARVKEQDVHAWRKGFLDALAAMRRGG